MTLSELIRAIGDEHIYVQNLLAGDLKVSLQKRDARITFYTGIEQAESLLNDNGKYVPMLLWIPADRIPAPSEPEQREPHPAPGDEDGGKAEEGSA